MKPRKSNRLLKKQEKKPKPLLKLPVKKLKLLQNKPLIKLIKLPRKLMPSRRELTRKLTHQRLKRHQPHQPHQLKQLPLQLPNQLPKLNKTPKFYQQLKKKRNKIWKARARDQLQNKRKARNPTKTNCSNLTSKLIQSDYRNSNIYFVFKKKLINIKIK